MLGPAWSEANPFLRHMQQKPQMEHRKDKQLWQRATLA